MLKLNYAIICENAFTDTEGKLCIIQTFDSINTTSKLPVAYPKICVVTNFSLEVNDIGKEYIHTIHILDPNNEMIASAKMPPLKPTGNKLQIISNFVGLLFKKSGTYKVKIIINEDEIENSASFNVSELSTSNERN